MNSAVLAFWGSIVCAIASATGSVLINLVSGEAYIYQDVLESLVTGGLIGAWVVWSNNKQVNFFLVVFVTVWVGAISSATVPVFVNSFSGAPYTYQDIPGNFIAGGIGGIAGGIAGTLIWRAWLSNKRQANSHPPY